MMHVVLIIIIASLSNADLNVHDGNGVVNDYAEVRNLLGEYHKLAARKRGFYNDYDPQHVTTALRSTFFDDGTEASTNRKEGVLGDLFENDILLTLPQAKALLRELRTRGTRQAQIGLQYYWPRQPISYVFAMYEPYGKGDLAYIGEDKTWWIPDEVQRNRRDKESKENGRTADYIQFIRGAGCWSNVGRIGGRQQISIGYGCEEGTQGNFEKRSAQTTDNMGEPYDLGSVMHYGPKAFAMDYSRNTIQTFDRNFQQTIGQRGRMSFKDIKMINKRYCSDVCWHHLSCRNGGYTDPNTCSQCKCPQGYGGKHCEDVEESAPSNCGGDMTATERFSVLKSPTMGGNMRCVWRITSSGHVLLVVDRLNFPCEDTCLNYLELKWGAEKTATGPRMCCSAPTVSFRSEGNDFIVILNTAKNVDARYQGFEIRYKSYGWNPPTTTPSTIIVSTTTTTLVTTITTTDRLTGVWSDWAGWSGCTQSCGGCGIRQRVRGCYSRDGRCDGPATMEEPCGLNPCPTPTNGIACAGKLVLPCELMDKLRFGTLSDNTAMFSDAPALVTINIDWKRPGEILREIRGCCPGYYISEGVCKKIE